jgi:hypothetical protein
VAAAAVRLLAPSAVAVAESAVAVQWEAEVARSRDLAVAAAVVHSPGEPGREVVTTAEIRSAEEQVAAAG